MNKKLLFVFIIIFVLIGLTGCSKKDNINEDDKINTSQNELQNNEKILVDYFSKTGENYNVGTVTVGNTALMASYIADYLQADTFEIVPVNKYSDDYQTSTEEAKKEQNAGARPKIKNELTNLDDYDIIFLGYPIWWGDLPMIVYTFLESYDLSGKTVIPFNTHEGSGSASTYQTIKNKLIKSKVNTNGLALQGKVARTSEGKNETIKWLKELGY